jgi:hypothetical protein
VLFAERLTKAPIILETHDLYSQLLANHGVPGFVPGGPDSETLRLVEEKQVWSRVAACVSVSAAEHGLIDGVARASAFIPPVLPEAPPRRPEAIAAHTHSAGIGESEMFDVMLWGSWHKVNVNGIAWFFEHVLPSSPALADARVIIVGSVARGLPASVLERANVKVTGFVDSIDEFAVRSRVLVVPDQVGTGVSIKALDAFRLDACFASTLAGFRGIDLEGLDYMPASSAKELSEDVARLLSSADLREKRAAVSRRIRLRSFSEQAYENQWDALLDRVGIGLPAAAE